MSFTAAGGSGGGSAGGPGAVLGGGSAGVSGVVPVGGSEFLPAAPAVVMQGMEPDAGRFGPSGLAERFKSCRMPTRRATGAAGKEARADNPVARADSAAMRAGIGVSR